MKIKCLFEYLDSGPRDTSVEGTTYASCLHCRSLIYTHVQVTVDEQNDYMYIQWNRDLGYFEKLELRQKFGIELSILSIHTGTSCALKGRCSF